MKHNALKNSYSLHRKKQKLFSEKILLQRILSLDESILAAHVKWLETVDEFYSEIFKDTELQTKLSRLKITVKDLNATNTLITELETARSEYSKEKGESQDATKQKDYVFAELDDWISKLYAVAKTALEDNIQLLEVLGIIIRN